MKQAAVYARVSTWEQAKFGYSMQYQTQVLPELAREQGYTVEEDDIFSEVLSGAKDDRPEYNRMIALILEGKYEAVFVVEKSRLSRTDSRLEEERVVKSLQRCGCVVITPHTVYDPSTVEGEFLWDILSAVDRNERKRIHARNARGKYAKAMKGGFCGGSIPTGYQKGWNKKTGEMRFIIDEEKMKPVRLAFQWVQEGRLVFHIAKDLHKLGYVTVNGKPLCHQTIKYWLKNPHYAGYTHIGGSLHPKTKQRHIFEANQFLDPIISKQDFQQVQTILQDRTTELITTRQPPNRHPLNGIIACPNCGGRMSVDVHHKSQYQNYVRWFYRCNSRYTSHYCLGEFPKTIPYNKIHLLLLELLQQLEFFGYQVNKEELSEFQAHILNDAPIQQLSDVRINQLKAIFSQYIRRLEYMRTGTSWHSYKYFIQKIITVADDTFIVNPYGELQKSLT